MARRRALAAFVVLAVIATAWLLVGRQGDRGERAGPPPIPPFARKDPMPKALPPGAEKDAPAPEAPPAPRDAAIRRLRVRAIDESAAPVAGATVEAYANTSMSGFPLGASPVAAEATARDGSAALRIGRGVYWLRAARGDSASVPALVGTDGPEATLVLQPARILRGLVVEPEGAPAAGFGVALSFRHAAHSAHFAGRTDAEGRFDLPLVPDAWLDRLEVQVGPPAPNYPGPFAWDFEVTREQLLSGAITLQLTMVRLRARVVAEDGMPVEGAIVQCAPPRASDSLRIITASDEDGRFETPVQRLSGEVFVIAAAGYAPLVWRPDVPPGDRKLYVPEIVLRHGVPLSGGVTDPAGGPVPGASVRLESPRLPGHPIAEATADAQGRFRFEATADEEHVLYSFRPVDPDLCLPQLRMQGVRGGPTELRVVLPDPIRGSVRFVAQGTGDAVQVEHLTLIVKDSRGTEAAKRTWEPSQGFERVRFEVWQEGTYDVEVYTARHEPARLGGVRVVRGRGPEVSVPLVPRR